MSDKKAPPTFDEVMQKASMRAMKGGLAGSMAGMLQVTSLMWVRTTMNYQYRYGGSLPNALKTLMADGGILRFYRGYGFAMFQAPLARFGDTAANVGALAILDNLEYTKDWNTGIKTLFGSASAASWRIFLMPIDACKTMLQVEGKDGLKKLGQKIKVGGPRVLWHGAAGAVSATFVGHYPWYATYNLLDVKVPKYEDTRWKKLGRDAGIGFCASIVSDTCSNSIRVLKAYKQTAEVPVTYPEAIKTIVAKDGIIGLFGRGLTTRYLANGLNGMLFSVAWKGFQDMLGM